MSDERPQYGPHRYLDDYATNTVTETTNESGQKKLNIFFIVMAVVITVTICVIVGSVLGGTIGNTRNRLPFNNRPSSSPVVPAFLSPGDTRIMPLLFNTFFCSELTLEVNSTRSGASVYLITDTPPLTDRNNFTISTNISIFPTASSRQSYRFWNYYLYPGSNFTTSLRLPFAVRSSGTFRVIRGRRNFQGFVHNPAISFTDQILDSFFIPCTNSYTRQYSLRVQDEGEYYFIYRRGSSCIRRQRNDLFRLQTNITVNRFQYSTAGLANAPRCSAVAGGQCTLHIPANLANYSALIVTDIPTSNPDWEENIDINFYCSSTRGWAYAVVVLVPLLLVIGVTITTVILLVVGWKKRDSLKAICFSRHNTQTTRRTVAAPTSAVRLQRIEHSTREADLERAEASPINGVQQPVRDEPHKPMRPADYEREEKKQYNLTAAPPPSYKESLNYPAQKTDLPPPYYSKK